MTSCWKTSSTCRTRSGAGLWNRCTPGFPGLSRSLATGTARDPEAFDEFMLGLRESYSDREETLRSADQHLSKAVERDPEFALAHAWLSHVSMQINFTIDAQRSWLEKAEYHCHRALTLDPHLESLREQPEFKRLIADLEHKYTAIKIQRL